MTLINMQFYTNTLQQTATISVILPEPRSSDQVSLTATDWPYMILVDLDDLLISELTSSVYIACGIQDDFYVDNQALVAKLTALAQAPIFVTEDIGHDWSFWDHQLQQVLHRFSNERIDTANAN